MSKKFEVQEQLYTFPYHYLPTVNNEGAVRLHRQMSWGLEYLTYMTFVVELIREQRPSSLLDVGCGDGRLLHLLQNDSIQLRGIDLSSQAIALAQAFNPGLDFDCISVADLSEQYQMVTLIEVLEHISDKMIADFMVATTQRVVPDGYMLVSVPSVNIPFNKKHYRHYNLSLLQETLAPYFTLVEHWWVYRQGSFSEWLSRLLLCNGLFTLNQRHLARLIWRWHRRYNWLGDERNGRHLVALAQLK